MDNSAQYSRFQLDPTIFSSKDTLFQNNNISIERAVESKSNKYFIIHTIPFNGFDTHSLLEFVESFLKNPINKYLLPFFGIISMPECIKIVYEDPGVTIIDIQKLSDEQKMEVLKSISKAVAYLHSKKISHLRIKPTSIFINPIDNSIYLGCISPAPIIDLDDEDKRLPFYRQPFETRDSYMFGLLIFELFLKDKNTQKDLLKQFWRFEAFPSDKPIFQLANKCLGFDYLKRPTFNEILSFFNEEKIEPADVSNSYQMLKEASSQINNILFLLIRAFVFATEKNYQKAIDIYKSEVLNNNAQAINNIAVLISKSKTPDSLSEAANLFHRAADIGFSTSQRNYAYALRNGIGIAKNKEGELNYLLKSAEQGYVDSLFGLYSYYFENEDPKAIKYLRKAAFKTYPIALHMYGFSIENGVGYPNDVSINFFYVGMENHYPYCMNNYATRIKDIEMSNKLWKEAAELGLKQAQYNYAVSLMIGRGGVEIDKEKAAFWMKKSSDQKYGPSMFDYALMLREGIGVSKDEETAEELCIEAGNIKLHTEIVLKSRTKIYKSIREKMNHQT